LAKVVVSLLIRLREFSPVNIIQPRTVPEVIQTTLSARDIAQEVSQMVEASAHQKVVTKLERVSELLYDAPIDSLSSGFVCNVSQRVSEIVQDVIKKKNASH
jgi:lipid A disaccharide synthetase